MGLTFGTVVGGETGVINHYAYSESTRDEYYWDKSSYPDYDWTESPPGTWTKMDGIWLYGYEESTHAGANSFAGCTYSATPTPVTNVDFTTSLYMPIDLFVSEELERSFHTASHVTSAYCNVTPVDFQITDTTDTYYLTEDGANPNIVSTLTTDPYRYWCHENTTTTDTEGSAIIALLGVDVQSGSYKITWLGQIGAASTVVTDVQQKMDATNLCELYLTNRNNYWKFAYILIPNLFDIPAGGYTLSRDSIEALHTTCRENALSWDSFTDNTGTTYYYLTGSCAARRVWYNSISVGTAIRNIDLDGYSLTGKPPYQHIPAGV